MTQNPSYGFKVSNVNELPDIWRTPPSNIEYMARMLKCDASDVGTAVTFSAPQCPLAMAYQAWLMTQHSSEMIGLTIENTEEWNKAFPNGMQEFMRAMREERHPSFKQLVRIQWIKTESEKVRAKQ